MAQRKEKFVSDAESVAWWLENILNHSKLVVIEMCWFPCSVSGTPIASLARGSVARLGEHFPSPLSCFPLSDPGGNSFRLAKLSAVPNQIDNSFDG